MAGKTPELGGFKRTYFAVHCCIYSLTLTVVMHATASDISSDTPNPRSATFCPHPVDFRCGRGHHLMSSEYGRDLIAVLASSSTRFATVESTQVWIPSLDIRLAVRAYPIVGQM